MKKDDLGKLYPIKVIKYDPEWPIQFEREKKELFKILGSGIALRIEHIGSTAVPGLSAKPTVDILIEIPINCNLNQIICRMIRNKYIHMKEQQKHLMFVKGYSPNGLEKESFHVHIGPKDQDWLWDRLYFRDYLKKNSSELKKYQNLKNELSIKYKHDREAYTDRKAGYIQKVTELAKREMQETSSNSE